MIDTKPYSISKQLVMDAFKAVKANAGAAGVDGQSIKDFEMNLKDNLYKIWNRMSSGTYFPPSVKAVANLKKNGGERVRISERQSYLFIHWQRGTPGSFA